VKAQIEIHPLEETNNIFDRLRQGKATGRVVLKIADEIS
jgi:D-arabinose 1-dehydrogenase-like Zn-dependent alcohol dehydrogenase